MAASARLFRQLAVRATAATGATTLLAVKCDGTKPPGTRELNRLPTKRRPSCSASRQRTSPSSRPPPSEPSTPSTRLHGLVETRDVEGLRSLLRDGHVNLAARNGDGLTALLVAARLREHEAAEIIRLLTDAGASVDDIDRLGRGALHLAALAGNPATTRVLLQRGADPRRVDARRGATPAHYAAAFARVDAMAMLCAHDAKAVRGRARPIRPVATALVGAVGAPALGVAGVAARRRRIAGGWGFTQSPRPDGRDAGPRGGPIGSRRVAGPAREARHGPARRARQPRRLAAGHARDAVPEESRAESLRVRWVQLANPTPAAVLS